MLIPFVFRVEEDLLAAIDEYIDATGDFSRSRAEFVRVACKTMLDHAQKVREPVLKHLNARMHEAYS
jgi:metal-responsive CopG/Arc/MetJ family transcriptional regulator